MNKKETLSYFKSRARDYNLVFKKSESSNLYKLTNRKTKEVVISNMTLQSMENLIVNGELFDFRVK